MNKGITAYNTKSYLSALLAVILVFITIVNSDFALLAYGQESASEFSFAKGNRDFTIKYGEEFSNTVSAGENASIEYKSSDSTIAAVDEAGNITTLKPGMVTITAICSSDECYNGKEISYNLIIERADQEIGFPESLYELVTGETFNAPVVAEIGENFGTGKITYQIENDTNGIIKSLDTATGEVELTYLPGEATILAAKEKDDNYNAATAEYVIRISEWKPEAKNYQLTGDRVNESGWFTGNVSVSAKDGYLLSYVQTNGNAEWKAVLEEVVTEDAVDNQISFYVKEITTGYISALYTETVMKDETLPTASITVEELSIWDKFLSIIGFDKWADGTADFTITYGDATSGVDTVWYYIDDDSALVETGKEKLDKITSWTQYIGKEAPVEKDKAFVIYAKVVDDAGNYQYASTNGIIFEKAAPEIKYEIKTDAVNGYYNDDIEINLSVWDPGVYSGIASVDYWVTCDDKETQKKNLYSFPVDSPSYGQLENQFNGTIVVEAVKNNSDYVVLSVKATDNAGNETLIELPFKIDMTVPVIALTYDDVNAIKVDADGRGYFNTRREATFTFIERTSTFDREAAVEVIKESITATDVNNKTVPLNIDWGNLEWLTEEGSTADVATHKVTISFADDAKYTINEEIKYTDKAGNTNHKPVDTKDSETPYAFTVDTAAPKAELKAGNFELTWNKLMEIVTFGLWDCETVEVLGKVSDETSPIESVQYFKTDNTVLIEDLSKVEWLEYEDVKTDTDYMLYSILPNERFTVYKRIIDYAGNTTYVSTDGIIVDNIKPEITISLPAAINGLYNSDVKVKVNVIDSSAGNGVYSGIHEIGYEVFNTSTKTQGGILYSYIDALNGELSTYDKLDKEEAVEFTVDASNNNSNEVQVVVYAIDNAGNKHSEAVDIKIDITEPEINVAYDNNEGDMTFGNAAYFKDNRTATITIRERNFNPNIVNIIITNDQGIAPVLSGWSYASGVGDNATHTATVVFREEGNYTFDINCYDEAGNNNLKVNYGKSLSPLKFTVDKTLPVIEVSYDNNDAMNGNYYNADRTATISITEQNFETSRIQVTVIAVNKGCSVPAPALSNWTTIGDVHTATIHYSTDAMYSFDMVYTDMAGNMAADFEEQNFCVDQTSPFVSISGIVDESANNSEGSIGFTIKATDTNFDVFKPALTVVAKNGDKFETRKIEVGEITNITDGKAYTVSNLELDGIYRISCTVADKAGNVYEEVTLYDNAGNPYTEEYTGGGSLIQFSVNRKGSAFTIDDYTADVVGKYYIQNVSEDLTVVEINPDTLREYKVTLNGKALSEGVDYKVTEEGGNGEWVKYTYVIRKELFANEGEYQVAVSSRDQAGNDAFSDVKGAGLSFIVDRTSPVVTVTGLATNGRYMVEKQLVTLIPTDDGGALKTLIVRLIDEDGNVIKEIMNLSGEALTEALETGEGKITFEMEEGLYQNVQIISDDFSVDKNENTNVYDNTFKNVSVSANSAMIFWVNKPLRYGSIAGAAGISLASMLFIVYRKRKKSAGAIVS